MTESILIIDDESRILQTLARNLEFEGYTVFTAQEGRTGIEIFAREHPAITFVDVRMPGLDGFAVLQAIRAHEPHAEVVLMTGHGDKDTVIAALRADATDFVSKPIEREVLGNVLRRAQERLRLKRELAAAQEALRATNTALEQLVATRTQELEQERALLRTLVDNIPIFITRYDRNGKLSYLNKAFEETSGWTTAEARSLDLLTAMYPDPDYRRQALDYMLQATADWREFRMVSKSGTPVDVQWSNIRLPDDTQVGIGIDVTARKQIESTLHESEKRYRLLTEGVADVLWIFDVTAMRFRYISPSVEQLLGYTPAELCQLDAATMFTPATLAYLGRVLPERIQAFERGEKCNYRDEIEQCTKDGARIWTEVICHYDRNEDTGHLEIYGVSRDITHRKQLELERQQMIAALQESEARYRLVVETSPDGIGMANPDGQVLFVNPQVLKLFGYTAPEELVGVDLFTLFAPEERGRAQALFSRLAQQETDTVLEEFIMLRRDGTRFHGIISAGAHHDAQGQPRMIIGLLRDITAQKQAEIALREQDERLRVISDNLPNGYVYQLDLGYHRETRRFTYLSAGVEKIHGVSVQQGLEDPTCIFNQAVADDLARVAALETQALASLQPFTAEVRIQPPGGGMRWLLIASTPRRLADGRHLADGIALDITDRKQAIEQLQFQAYLLEVVGEAIIATDLEGKISYLNPCAERLYGWSLAEAVGKNIIEITVPTISQEEAAAIMAAVQAGHSWSGEFTVKNRQGRTFPVLVTNVPLRNPEGRVVGIVGISRELHPPKGAECLNVRQTPKERHQT